MLENPITAGAPYYLGQLGPFRSVYKNGQWVETYKVPTGKFYPTYGSYTDEWRKFEGINPSGISVATSKT